MVASYSEDRLIHTPAYWHPRMHASCMPLCICEPIVHSDVMITFPVVSVEPEDVNDLLTRLDNDPLTLTVVYGKPRS